MNIRSLKLNPFAGTQDRIVPFQRGLNVILGANEAGKSTLIKALRCLFFISPNVTPKAFKNEISPFMPILGGDTIRVSAEIDLNGETYNIEKEFGEIKRAKIVLPSKAEINNITQIDAELTKMLGFSRATYEQVLITYQTDLARTIEKLKNTEGAETRSSLSNKLRSVLIELDGVPADKLKEEAESFYNEYFSNWDEEKNIPRDGKDINNPHKRSVGEILKAYYTLRQLEVDLAEVEKYEARLDELNVQLNLASEELKILLDYKLNFEPVYTDAQKRLKQESQVENLSRNNNEWSDVFKKWPGVQTKWLDSKVFRENKSGEISILDKQIKEWKDYNNLTKLREKRDRIIQLEKQNNIELNGVNNQPKITNNDITFIKNLNQKVRDLNGELKGSKLKLFIKAKNNISFIIKKGASEKEHVEFLKDDVIQEDILGRLQFENSDFTLVVSSGEDIKKTLTEIGQKENELKTSLHKWGVTNVEAMEKILRDKEYIEKQVNERSNEINRLLDGKSLADLETQINSVKRPETLESQEALEERRNALKIELGIKQKDEEDSLKQIKEWASKYESQDTLLRKLLENKTQLSEVEKNLNSLKSLPENYKNTEDFLSDYQLQIKKLEAISKTASDLKLQIAELKAPHEFSTEELNEKLEAAKANFESTLKKGRAYKKVLSEISAILDELYRDTFTPLKEKTEYYFNKLTNGKYGSLRLNETVPDAIEMNGKFLPADLLSTGTLDLLALATRLAMADFHLEENKGFIVLDDPLVNLDPQRQQLAAKCLQEISGNRQIIVLTCHPAHAHLLQGNLIEL